LRGGAMRRVKLINASIMLVLGAAATSSSQTPSDLGSASRARIEQARASIVKVAAESESGQIVSQAMGFFIRNDLVATDLQESKKNSRVHVTTATKGTLKVVSSGNYFLPYVLLETQAEVSPLRLGDSERVALNDSVYMLGDSGTIVAGTVTGTATIKDTRAFLITLTTNSNNKGSPIFNRNGEVIGIAAESPEGQGAGLVLPSSLLARLKHLGEPGVGAGIGEGPRFPVTSASTGTDTSAASRVDTKPVRLSSPHPGYTEAARKNHIQGTVTLRMLVGADGAVEAVRVIRGLPDGLTERAIEAARQAKFKPATKDGKPVPYWIILLMEFNIR
jgi:TonB family protein